MSPCSLKHWWASHQCQPAPNVRFSLPINDGRISMRRTPGRLDGLTKDRGPWLRDESVKRSMVVVSRRGGVMTKAEWSACTEPTSMLDFLEGKVSERKLRLLACAMVRHVPITR